MGVSVAVLLYFEWDEIDVPPHAVLVVPAPHESLDREDGILRVRYGLPLGCSANVALAALRIQRHHRGGGASSLGVLYHARLASFDDRHARVGRAKIDSQYLRHYVVSLSLFDSMGSGCSGRLATTTCAARSTRFRYMYPS